MNAILLRFPLPQKRPEPVNENEFSPAVLELIERPTSPIPGYMCRAIMATLIGFGFLTYVTRYDVVSVAPGKVVAHTKQKSISAMEQGYVQSIRVNDGDVVKAGDVLVELDPKIRIAELEHIKAELDEARLSLAEADAMRRDPPQKTFETPAGIFDPKTVQPHLDQLASHVSAYEAKLENLRAQLTVQMATVEKLAGSLPALRAIEISRRETMRSGFTAKNDYYKDWYTAETAEGDVNVQRAAIETKKTEIKLTIEDWYRVANNELVSAELKIRQLEQDYEKAKQLVAFQTLKAPVDGRVEQLQVHTTGGVVKPGDTLMVVVPDEPLRVEASVSNLDIGFVQEGQPVVMKTTTYPYKMYGYLTGTVESLSQDGFADSNGAISFPMRVKLDQDSIEFQDKKLLVTAGMTVSAEIHTTTRYLWQYLASVVLRIPDESFRER